MHLLRDLSRFHLYFFAVSVSIPLEVPSARKFRASFQRAVRSQEWKEMNAGVCREGERKVRTRDTHLTQVGVEGCIVGGGGDLTIPRVSLPPFLPRRSSGSTRIENPLSLFLRRDRRGEYLRPHFANISTMAKTREKRDFHSLFRNVSENQTPSSRDDAIAD